MVPQRFTFWESIRAPPVEASTTAVLIFTSNLNSTVIGLEDYNLKFQYRQCICHIKETTTLVGPIHMFWNILKSTNKPKVYNAKLTLACALRLLLRI